MIDKWIPLDSDDITPDTTTLWRYMDLPKFLWLVEHKQLYFPSVPALWPNDSYEGFKTPRATERVIEKELGPRYAAVKQEREQGLKRLAPCTYVSCWRRSDHHSRVMWEHYASQNGVAIETTVRELLNNLDTPMTALRFVSPIIYLDFDNEDDKQGIKDGKKHLESLKSHDTNFAGGPGDSGNRPFVEASTLLYRRKRQEFDLEKEYRLFIMTSSTPDACADKLNDRWRDFCYRLESNNDGDWVVGARKILGCYEPQHQEKLLSCSTIDRRAAIDPLCRDGRVRKFLDQLADFLFPIECKPKEPKRGLALPILSLEQLIKEVHIDPHGQNPELLKEVVRSYLDVHDLKKIPVHL